MQLPADPDDAAALAEALAQPVQRPCWRLRVDWNRNGLYDHPLSDLTDAVDKGGMDVERSITSDLPEEASLVSGKAAAEATIKLTGKIGDRPAAQVLSPYRTDSPLFGNTKVGCQVQIEMGLITRNGPVMLPQITGPLRALDIVSGGHEVELTVADPSENLRAPITLPVGTIHYGRSLRGSARYPFRARTQWVIDYILRRNGYGSPLHPSCKMSLTCHGSLFAEIGQATTPDGNINPPVATDEDYWVEGPHGLLAAGGAWIEQPFVPVMHDGYEAVPGSGFGLSMWVYHGQNIGSDAAIKILTQTLIHQNGHRLSTVMRGDSGALGFGMDNSPLISIPGSACLEQGWRYLGVHFAINDDGTYTPTSRFLGETVVHAPQPMPALDDQWRFSARTFALFFAPMSDIQAWYDVPTAPVSDWPGEGYTGTLDLEAGLNRLSHLPTRAGVDSWSLMQEVAAAEFGLVGFNESGDPFFVSRGSERLDPGTVERVIDAGRDLHTLGVGLSLDTVRNSAVVETMAAYENGAEAVFAATTAEEFDSPVGVTDHIVQIGAQTLPWGGEQELPRIASAQWSDFVDNGLQFGYVAVRQDDPATEVTTGLRVFAYPTGALGRDLLVRVDNQSGGSVRFTTTNGTPALRAVGYPIADRPPQLVETVREASVEKYGARALGIDRSDWHQTMDPVLDVADLLLYVLDEPVAVLPSIRCNGDPRLQLGDTIELRDRTGIADSITASVVTINRRCSVEDGLVDEYGLRPANANAELGVLDDTERGRLDDTLILSI